MAPHTPQCSERPGGAVPLLCHPSSSARHCSRDIAPATRLRRHRPFRATLIRTPGRGGPCRAAPRVALATVGEQHRERLPEPTPGTVDVQQVDAQRAEEHARHAEGRRLLADRHPGQAEQDQQAHLPERGDERDLQEPARLGEPSVDSVWHTPKSAHQPKKPGFSIGKPPSTQPRGRDRVASWPRCAAPGQCRRHRRGDPHGRR